MCEELEKTEIIYDFLMTAELPEGFISEVADFPKMTADQAFLVIYILQESCGFIPESIEKCDACDELFDSDSSGFYLDEQYELNGKTLPKKYYGHWCDNCVPCVDFQLM